MAQGGRLFYLGAGTSGRLGILDASECPPTFNVSADLIQGLIAGGSQAIFQAVEGAEDNPSGAIALFKERDLSSKDLVMGIAASGLTPYVLGGIDYARQLGCGTLYFTCSPSAATQVKADIKIVPAVGPEVITGSTRMKAGTATKLVLNMITTGAMIKIGKTYGNLMIDLQPKNAKLKDRSVRILAMAADLETAKATTLLNTAKGNLKLALIMALCNTNITTGQQLLKEAQGHIKKAVAYHENQVTNHIEP